MNRVACIYMSESTRAGMLTSGAGTITINVMVKVGGGGGNT